MIRTLSCHCGAVRLETTAELGVVTECNCSTCAKMGYLSWRAPQEQVRLATPKVGLSAYQWRDPVGGHLFCPRCGVTISRTGPGGYFTLNARCLDDVDIFTLEVERYDGRREMPGGEVPPLA
jgi:hypothetical protein